MLNCGALVDVEELLAPSEHQHIYVIDAHRPCHLSNLFTSALVCCFASEKALTHQVTVLDDGETDRPDSDLIVVREAYERTEVHPSTTCLS